jgi:hypothetical protein
MRAGVADASAGQQILRLQEIAPCIAHSGTLGGGLDHAGGDQRRQHIRRRCRSSEAGAPPQPLGLQAGQGKCIAQFVGSGLRV